MAAEVTQIKVAELVRAEGPVSFPPDWTWDDLIAFAQRGKERDEQPVSIVDTIHAFPFDGALALYKAIERKFGVAITDGATGLFGLKQRAQLITVEVGPDERITIPWGEFLLPANAGKIVVGGKIQDKVPILTLQAVTLRKYEQAVREVIELARHIVHTESIYRGKALRLFYNESFFDGEWAEVRFMNLKGVATTDLVFARELERAINVNIWAPLRYGAATKAIGVPGKRGVLLVGKYGTGKTLLASVTAQIAVQHQVTFVYVEDIHRLPDAFVFAQQYAKAIVFVEDIDRVANDRDDELNEILNALDGIESKDADVMVVMTTNYIDRIHPSLRDRPGRVDVIIEIDAPDAEAAERLLRKYGRGLLAEDEDLAGVAEQLAGQIPAVIREVVERAKLAMVARTEGQPGALVAEDLATSCFTVLRQRQIAAREHKPEPTALELLGDIVGSRLAEGLRDVATSREDGHGAAWRSRPEEGVPLAGH